MSKNICSKRVIVHAGLDLNTAISVALTFEKDHIESQGIKTGVFHSRVYAGPDGQTYRVYHTETSIIVSQGVPAEKPQVEGALEDKPQKGPGIPT